MSKASVIHITRIEKVAVKYLKVQADPRYWDDATVNRLIDEDGLRIPFRVGDSWSPLIDLEAGAIVDWPKGTVADIHYKVCDAGRYALLDADGKEVAVRDGYVPKIMSPGGNGYGDYIIMKIDADGIIENWDNCDIDQFEISED